MMKARLIPNFITVGRILLVYPIIHGLLTGQFGWALVLFVVAGLSDGVDGFLAKYYHWESRLGSYLDPLADKLLLISCYVVLAWLKLIPLWLTVLVLLRDLVILGGATAYYFLLRPFEGQPLFISKLNTLLQLVLVFTVLVKYGLTPIPDAAVTLLIALVTLTTLASGALYVYVWGARYRRETRTS